VSAYIPVRLRRQVRERELGLCAYCLSAERMMGITFEVDHIIPRAAGGESILNNLCLACPTCNRYKANRTLAIDPDTGHEVPLFHPTVDRWTEHFIWQEAGAILVGQSASGRATVEALHINRLVLVQLRRYWIALRLHPPVV
jgi:5-methylcytosine-specific restriction endonuclease McrA